MTKSKILEKIKKGKIEMKPKSYFVLKTIIYVLVIIFAFLFAIFLISFIIFSLRISGAWYFPAFGFRGLGIFLISFPWLLLILGIILVVILEILAKKFSIVYRKPLVYSILIILVVVLLMGVVVARTPMHKGLFMGAQEGRLPIMGPMYRGHFVESPPHACIGRVVDFIDNGFQIETEKGESVRVIISSKTQFSLKEEINNGDLIIIMGERKDSIIEAIGVRKIRRFPQMK